MRKKLLSLALIGAIALLFGLSTPVAAVMPPMMPHALYGDVIIDGVPAPNGTTVSAHIGALSWSTTTSGGQYGYSPSFMIPADNPATPAKDGGVDGDTITFKVGGVVVPATTAIFRVGGATELDLIIGAPPAEPTIGRSPTSFAFSATEGGANPSNQTLQVWNAGGGTLNWSVSDDAVWLSLAPPSGSSTGEHDAVTVSVNISGKTAGSYNATITITATGATNTPQTVPVTLNISPPPEPTIGRSPTSFTFSGTEGGANPSSKTLEVWNAGGSTLSWSVSEVAAWLSLSPTSGSSTGEHDAVTVSVDITGMTAGSYPATITITATGATNTPQTVPVTLNISAPGAPPVGGTAYIPSKPSILGPWIGLLLIPFIVGGTILWRRRRARQISIG
jgi:hypothetical protein